MREFALEDVDAVYGFLTCPHAGRFTGDAGRVRTKQDAEDVIRDVWIAGYKKYGYARYALIHKGDQRLIGFCGLKFDLKSGLPDLGYRMLPEYWGQGHGTEAVLAVLDYARDVLGLEKIFAEVVDQNTASNKLLLKAGFCHVDSYKKDGQTIYRYE